MRDLRFVDCEDLPENPDAGVVYKLLPKNPDENYYNERTDRNIGWITKEEQKILKNSVVGIAGCGGMGAQLAEKFLRLGVGEIRIADCEVFDISNINRQFAASRISIGHSKAFVTARMLRNVSDDNTVVVYPQGITTQTVENFLDGCDVICDEIEFWAIGARILLHERARSLGISLFNCNTVGFGTHLFLFTPESATMEDCLRFSYMEAVELENKFRSGRTTAEETQMIMERVFKGLFPEFPNYSGKDTEESIAVVRRRLTEEGKGAIIATNPPFATGLLADRTLLYLLRNSGVERNITDVPLAPSYFYFDAAKVEAKVVRGLWW